MKCEADTGNQLISYHKSIIELSSNLFGNQINSQIILFDVKINEK